jgi:hypothetical protein
MELFAKDVIFGVVSDLYKAGTDEDGDFIAEAYFVMAEDSKGRRWTHCESFEGAEQVEADDGWWYWSDIREEAKSKAELIVSLLEVSRSMDGFRRTESAYGSEAYSQDDEDELMDFEARKELVGR